MAVMRASIGCSRSENIIPTIGFAIVKDISTTMAVTMRGVKMRWIYFKAPHAARSVISAPPIIIDG